MRRFISYIYHYADGTYKCGNVGFCKVEQEGTKRTISLCVKDVKPMEGACKIFKLKDEEKRNESRKVYSKYLEDKVLSMRQGQLSEKVCIEGGDGLLLQCGDRQYVVLWKNCEETICIVDGVEHIDNHQDINKDVHKDILPDKMDKTSNKSKEASEYQRLYNRLCKSRMILENDEYQVVKLKPQDLMWFPRCHWRLINNCFVMDGYYRYGHILFLIYKEQFIFAVPAVETAKTPDIAKKFGFPHKLYGSEYGREDIKRPYWYMII